MRPRRHSSSRTPVLSDIRIIGGKWRGRKLPVPQAEGLRPTPNRLRETLFNWLQFDIYELRCADLYAGTGVLGLEALSRGVGSCDFCETDRRARQMLQENLSRLGAAEVATVNAVPALSWLRLSGNRYDLIFVDPPFADDAWQELLTALPAHLTPGARVYLERPARYSAPWSQDWECLKESRAGDVIGALIALRPQENKPGEIP